MPRCSCSCRWWSGVTPWTKAAEASAEPPQRSAAPLYFHTGTEIRSVWDDYSKGRHDFNFYKFLDQTRDSTFGLRQVPSQYQVHFSVLQLFKYINKSNPTKKNQKKILLWFRCSCLLQTTQVCWKWEWISSTRLCWGSCPDWQRCKFPHFPYCRRPWWRPLCSPGLDQSSTRLH